MSRQLTEIEKQLQAQEFGKQLCGPPVIFFTASSRIWYLSLNAAFSLVASWAVRLAGVKVVHAVCHQGMLQCMLGTKEDHPTHLPPCTRCEHFSDRLYQNEVVAPLIYNAHSSKNYQADLLNSNLQALRKWKVDDLPLGELCLPTVRWALRRHNLRENKPTRQLLRSYLTSAVNLVRQFEQLFSELKPRALVVFNGVTYPEAVARQVALSRGISVVTHEVGLRPLSAFFSHDHATAYPIEVPCDFHLSPAQNRRLDCYLNDRFQGKFTMAGIKFWPRMEGIPKPLIERLDAFKQIVVVFTNIIFDTSQVHANTLYEDMFAWLDELAGVIPRHPETLFIIRAHPDEDRPGKASRESVTEWLTSGILKQAPNVYFLEPSDRVSSYELIWRAKFILIYNSSIGLEASIIGSPVLSAGRSRFTQIPIVTFPSTRETYLAKLEEYLKCQQIDVPREFSENARRFLYYQLYHSSLDLSDFLEQDTTVAGSVKFKMEGLSRLCLDQSQELEILANGILKGHEFIYNNNTEDAY